jgi:hypothetical protein
LLVSLLVVIDPDNEHWYYIHHHLDHSQCTQPNVGCARDLYISPLNFNDDGSIVPVFPAENLHVEIYQPSHSAAETAPRRERRSQRIALE